MNARDAMAGALAMHRSGQLREAEHAYRQLLERTSNKAPLWHLLGLARLQQGDAGEAIALFRQALDAGRRLPAIHVDLGAALRSAGRPAEAVEAYRAALGLDASLVSAWQGLAAAEHDRGHPVRAVVALREALGLQPEDPRLRFNIATLLVETGDFEGAAGIFAGLAREHPADDRVQAGLAGALFGAGDLAGAETAFRRSLEARPDDVDRLCGLGRLLLADDRPAEAETVLREALRLMPGHPSARFNLGAAMVANGTMDPDFLTDWFAVPGPVPPVVSTAVIDHLLDSPFCARLADGDQPLTEAELATLAAAPMLRGLLRRTLIDDDRLERLLTRARLGLVDAEVGAEFAAAMAWQCFLNEYVYRETAEETAAVEGLAERLVDDLASGTVDEAGLLLYACYRPLHSLGTDSALMAHAARAPAAPLAAVIRQQVTEPREERLIAAGIPRLTGIDDEVSRAVRAQYEGNPYPRWQAVARLESAPVESVLTGLFPRLAGERRSWPASPRILVAGCGTGHHTVGTAQRFANSRVIGVDLSLASLAYAARKTREAGLQNIDYRQADILELGGLSERFDIIESAGVLHHMADPLAGWRVLRGLLVPGGFMKIGLYSERGRASIVAARALIADLGLGSDPRGIRQGRDRLAALPADHPARQVLERPDFYATSTCRDMLFHVQEHRYRLPEIGRMLESLDLEFLGFELPGRAAVRRYRRRFPDDPALASLANWDAFEAEYPQTFAGMFLFWVRDRRVD